MMFPMLKEWTDFKEENPFAPSWTETCFFLLDALEIYNKWKQQQEIAQKMSEDVWICSYTIANSLRLISHELSNQEIVLPQWTISWNMLTDNKKMHHLKQTFLIPYKKATMELKKLINNAYPEFYRNECLDDGKPMLIKIKSGEYQLYCPDCFRIVSFENKKSFSKETWNSIPKIIDCSCDMPLEKIDNPWQKPDIPCLSLNEYRKFLLTRTE